MKEENQLSVQGITGYLGDDFDSSCVYVYDCLESTNKTAKKMASENCPHGTVVIADAQTAGRGRYGRTFFSPSGSGLYISIVLHTKYVGLCDFVMITAAAAVITAEVIEKCTGVSCGIKWVNDLYIKDKKVCGILAEGIANHETGDIDKVVVGIGINIDTVSFPEEIKDIAASVFYEKTDGTVRNRIAAELIRSFLYSDILNDEKRIMEEYRRKQILLGETVTVHGSVESYEAKVLDVDAKGKLIVQKTDGTTEALFSGEVSVKKVR